MRMRRRGMKAGTITIAAVMGSVVLTGCGGDDEPKADGGASSAASGSAQDQERSTKAVRAAYDRTAEAESARMTVRTRLAAEDRTITSEGKGVLDLAGGDSVMTITAEGQSLEQRVVDEVLYQKAPEGKPWIKIDLEKVAAQQGVGNQQFGDPARTAAFAKAITDKDVTEVGTEKIDGVNTTHYRVSVDVAELPGGDRMREQLGPTLPMQVWLDDDGRLRRQQIDMTVKNTASASVKPGDGSAPQQLKMSTVMQFSDFGTEVDTEAPPAGQVTDVTDRALQGGGQQS